MGELENLEKKHAFRLVLLEDHASWHAFFHSLFHRLA